MTDTTHAVVFREEDGKERLTFRTTHPLYRKSSGMLLQIVQQAEKYPFGELDRDEVEELHQFTYEILAGRTGDPRLIRDAEIVCGAEADSPRDGHLECALPDGHQRVGDFDHVSSRGILFDTPGKVWF